MTLARGEWKACSELQEGDTQHRPSYSKQARVYIPRKEHSPLKSSGQESLNRSRETPVAAAWLEQEADHWEVPQEPRSANSVP